MKLHCDGASVDVLKEVIVHVNDVFGCEAIFGFVSHHQRGAVHLKLIESVCTKSGGFTFPQEIHCCWRQCGTNDMELQKVFSMLQVNSFLVCLIFSSDLCLKGVHFCTIGELSELSWRNEENKVKFQ